MTRSTSISRFPSITNPQGLTIEEMKKFPAIFASAPHPKMSERYTFLSTADIIEPLMKDGYIVTHIGQRATRYGHRDPRFTRHLVRLRRLKDKPVVGDVYPEVHLQNSHDGQCRYLMNGGLLRLLCLNGMAISTLEFKGISLFHRGELDPMLKQIREGVESAGGVLPLVEKMANKKVSAQTQKSFAQKAAHLVWNTIDFDTSILLNSRREEDKGDDAWRVYNRVQENIMRGGIGIQHTAGQHRTSTTRGITHLGREQNINLELWKLATKLAA
jgi:Domain of unknown function (DUF932)